MIKTLLLTVGVFGVLAAAGQEGVENPGKREGAAFSLATETSAAHELYAQSPDLVQNTQKILVPLAWQDSSGAYDISQDPTNHWKKVMANIAGKDGVECLLMDFLQIALTRPISDIKPGEGFGTFANKMNRGMPVPTIWNGGKSADDLICTGLSGVVDGQNYEVFSAFFEADSGR